MDNVTLEDKNSNPRIGQVVDKTDHSDNGPYIKGTILETGVNFLVDSGATTSLISRETYDLCKDDGCDLLLQQEINIQGVDGTHIKAYGYVDLIVKLGSYSFEKTFIVCDIASDGILGQDFLLKYVKSWDLEAHKLILKHGNTIECYTKSGTSRVCRVLVKETVQIPPQSCILYLSTYLNQRCLQKQHI